MINTQSRRHFLRSAAGLAAVHPLPGIGLPLAGLAALAAQSTQAADLTGPYKAVVCLFLHGGCDTHNWVVPTDPTGYAQYASARGELAWPLQQLQPITSTGQAAGRSFGMPEELAPLRKWYEAGQAAIVANVGPLVRPITRADYLAKVSLPSKLFSHNDQSSTWQSLLPEGAPSGWGGRMGDILMSANAYPVFTSVSTNGNAVFLSGNAVTQYQVNSDGPVQVLALNNNWLFGSNSATAVLQHQLASTGTQPLQSEYTRVMQRAISTSKLLETSLSGVNVPNIPTAVVPTGASTTTLDKTSLARQLRVVGQMISAGSAMGMRRQVFMVGMGGFDTHSNQMRDQPGHMAQVAQSIDYFMSTMASMGMLNNVALFTASDFGRTLLSNGNGSDHGWGSHHFVLGGAVRGRNIHGQFPITALGAANDVGSGRLLPSTAVVEYAASLGRWMGLNNTEVSTALPGLSNFNNQLAIF